MDCYFFVAGRRHGTLIVAHEIVFENRRGGFLLRVDVQLKAKRQADSSNATDKNSVGP